MLNPNELSRRSLVGIVTRIRDFMYVVETDEEGEEVFDPDQSVNGGDLVDVVADVLNSYHLAPEIRHAKIT